MILEYGDVQLKVLNDYSIEKSSQEVTFNAITCDFTGNTQEDLPDKYQEVKLIENGNIIFFGYLDSYSFSEMREKDVETLIEFTLLSPMELATLRTVILSGTYRLKELINQVLQPLIDDGFEIKDINIADRTITVNYQLDTVEYCMNNLSNKFNFWWFIDELKKIHIEDIENMMKKKPDFKYDDENIIPYMQYIKPSVSADGYANVINFKNVRLYDFSNLEMNNTTITSTRNPLIDGQLKRQIKKDEQVDFIYPCDITQKNIEKSGISQGLDMTSKYTTLYGLYVKGTYTDNTTFDFEIVYKPTNDAEYKYIISNNIGFDNKESDKDKEFLLIRDSFFSNLIIGFKYNNEEKNIKSIEVIKSDSILIYNIVRMYNDVEIANKKSKISNTGIIETTVDMNESWKTLDELRQIGANYMNKNSMTFDNEIEIKLDTLCNMQVGNTVQIDKMYFNGTYIITKINTQIINNETEYIVIAKNGNMLSNFIDIFRGENTQDSDVKTYEISVIHYAEENINEKFEVVK